MSYPFATATATILRAIKAGKVSGTKDGSGQIETAELHEIYPRNGADTDAAVELGMAAPPLVPVERMPAHAELRLRAALAEERLSEMKAALDDMRRDRDAWRDSGPSLATSVHRPRRPAAVVETPGSCEFEGKAGGTRLCSGLCFLKSLSCLSSWARTFIFAGEAYSKNCIRGHLEF